MHVPYNINYLLKHKQIQVINTYIILIFISISFWELFMLLIIDLIIDFYIVDILLNTLNIYILE